MKTFEDYLEMVNRPITFIQCDNKKERDAVLKFAKENDKSIGNIEKIDEYPLYLNIHGQIVGWTDKGDRAADYASFSDFEDEKERFI